MAKKVFDLSSMIKTMSSLEAAPGERDIETITAEILRLKQEAGNAVLAIGQRLIEAKGKLAHGEWLRWLSEQVEFSERSAQNLMRLAREWSNPQALADLGATKALTLLALPAEERDQFLAEYHVVNGEEKRVADMTSRELEEAVRERDMARQAVERAQADAAAARESLEKLSEDNAHLKKLHEMAVKEEARARKELETVRGELRALKNKPVDVAVMAVDQEKLDAAQAEAVAEMQAKVDKAQAAKDRADEKRRESEAALAEATAKLEAAARAQRKEAIAGDQDLVAFELIFGQVQDLANKLQGILLKVRSREDPDAAGRLAAALLAFSERVKELTK